MTDDSSLITTTRTRQRCPRVARQREVVEPLSRVSERVGLSSLATRLTEVRHFMAGDLSDVEAQLTELCALPSGDLARQAAQHLLRRPGKRIRPLCVMLGAQLVAAPIDDSIRDIAVACELVHAATLLHDDVIDEGTERRGVPTARMVFGNSAAVLAGDYLLVEALERVSRASRGRQAPPGGSAEVLTSLLDTIAQMVSAEALQLEMRGRIEPSRDAYLQIIEGKTASLFRWALCAAPVLCALGDEQLLDALTQIGTAFGTAFQLVDDVLDLEGDPEQTGKDLFADLLQGKLTWPLIVASDGDRTLIDDVQALSGRAAAGELDAAAAAAIVQRIRASGALEQTRAFADSQRSLAREALSLLPECEARRALAVLIDAAVERRK